MNDPSEEDTKDCLLCNQLTIFGSTLKDSFFLTVEDDYLTLHAKLIFSAVRSKTQDRNLTNSGANISSSGLHGRQCSEYYAGLNMVLDMKDSVNPNAVSLHSDDFLFLVNTNGPNKDRF